MAFGEAGDAALAQQDLRERGTATARKFDNGDYGKSRGGALIAL
jgi:hypothetical protein